MESILEAQRRGHEELERIDHAIVGEFTQQAKSHREKIAQDTRINKLLERAKERSKFLARLYQDVDGARQEEIDALSGPNEFGEFYKRLKTIKDYHRRFPNEVAEPMEMEFVQLEKDRADSQKLLESLFTGEEGFGKYLDLNAVYLQYVNLKNIEHVSYIPYLDIFDKFDSFPRETKNTAEYKSYIENLLAYLISFIRRAQPLLDLDSALHDIELSFHELWQRDEVPGWSNRSRGGESPELFCAACVKFFAKSSVFDAHITGKKHQKAAAQLLAKNGGKVDQSVIEVERQVKEAQRNERERAVALVEYKISSIVTKMLPSQREATKSMVELKQSRTGVEQEEDKEEVAEETDEEVEDEEKPMYNPLNLPLGWDGKPIPYWLYKLHGLSVTYYCEICDSSFKGRKSFERHFTDWNHANMLRRLGIPNTSQFHEITKVADALALWEKIQQERAALAFKAEVEEEFEDRSGNVFNKKTYEDLKRQGLL